MILALSLKDQNEKRTDSGNLIGPSLVSGLLSPDKSVEFVYEIFGIRKNGKIPIKMGRYI